MNLAFMEVVTQEYTGVLPNAATRDVGMDAGDKFDCGLRADSHNRVQPGVIPRDVHAVAGQHVFKQVLELW